MLVYSAARLRLQDYRRKSYRTGHPLATARKPIGGMLCCSEMRDDPTACRAGGERYHVSNLGQLRPLSIGLRSFIRTRASRPSCNFKALFQSWWMCLLCWVASLGTILPSHRRTQAHDLGWAGVNVPAGREKERERRSDTLLLVLRQFTAQ